MLRLALALTAALTLSACQSDDYGSAGTGAANDISSTYTY